MSHDEPVARNCTCPACSKPIEKRADVERVIARFIGTMGEVARGELAASKQRRHTRKALGLPELTQRAEMDASPALTWLDTIGGGDLDNVANRLPDSPRPSDLMAFAAKAAAWREGLTEHLVAYIMDVLPDPAERTNRTIAEAITKAPPFVPADLAERRAAS